MPNNQEPEETRAYRHIQIQQAFLWKGYHCDICGGFAQQTHELAYRSSTMNNLEARRLSFQKELTSILCERCHAKAHTPETTQLLLNKNIEVYGREAVGEALVLLQSVLKGKLSLQLPEEIHE